MSVHQLFTLFLFILSTGCVHSPDNESDQGKNLLDKEQSSIPVMLSHSREVKSSNMAGRGALLLSRFKSFEELKSVVKFEYSEVHDLSTPLLYKKPMVVLSHQSSSSKVTGILKMGVNEGDFSRAQEGGIGSRLILLMKSPYSILSRKDLKRVHTLARRRGDIFGEGDAAFYDLAESMMKNITEHDKSNMPAKDLSEKGYINTFNHITAQAFMTSLFSERLADLVADSHERFHMPELISGEFSEDQLADIENGPTDNYVDVINNEWGQELGKHLKVKYNINRETNWTPESMADYLNDIQSYSSWAFQIGFEPFRSSDDVVLRFSSKVNRVMNIKSESE